MKRIINIARYILLEFGPLVIFWGVATTMGARAGIAGAMVMIVVGVLWRFVRGLLFTRIYILVAILTTVFGVIDLLSDTPSMIIYESVITNIVTGCAFIVGSFGKKPMIQEMAEQRAVVPFPDRADIRRFFQIFTLFWAVYFFVKAVFYFWIAQTLPLTEAVAARSLVGGVSLGLMIAVSVTQGKRLFLICRKLGLLPTVSEPEAAPASSL